MMIQMKDAVNMTQVIYPWLDNKDLSITAKYKLAKLYKRISEESDFYRTNLNNLIAEYAIMDENGNYENKDGQVAIQPDKINEFNRKLQDLLNLDILLDDNLQFEVADLEPLNPTVKMLLVLEPLIK